MTSYNVVRTPPIFVRPLTQSSFLNSSISLTDITMTLRRTLIAILLVTPCLSSSTPQPTLRPRQDDMETRTVDVLTSSMELQGDATAVIPSPTTSSRLETATTPIQLADVIGLIMPNPWSKVYVGMSARASRADYQDSITRWGSWMSFRDLHRPLEDGCARFNRC